MSDKQQPPIELVEKFTELYRKHVSADHDSYYDFMIDCAQIAVEHAEKENRELRENIIELNSAIDEWWNGERSDNQIKKINAVQKKSFKLLNKTEDGKE